LLTVGSACYSAASLAAATAAERRVAPDEAGVVVIPSLGHAVVLATSREQQVALN